MTTGTKRTPSETTLKVRAFGKVERLNAEIRKMQEAERERRAKYEARINEAQAERDEYVTNERRDRDEAAALERGRQIGRLEGLADAFECPWDDNTRVGITVQSMRMLAPILRAEIGRLKEVRP